MEIIQAFSYLYVTIIGAETLFMYEGISIESG